MKYVIGLFDERTHANAAEERVRSYAKVREMRGSAEEIGTELHGYGLRGSELDAFREGARRGGILVRAEVEESEVPRAVSDFRGSGSVDLDRRLKRWRTEGWTGYDTKAPMFTGEALTRERELGRGEIHVPVVEEKLAVGKREVEGGGVTIEKEVTTRPVEETVRLKEEKIDVERHPVDRPLRAGEELRDETIEVRAKTEEPVVSKEARVVEEVVVSKEQKTREEKVKGEVKRTDVKVEPRTSRSSIERDSRTSVH